MNCNSLQLLVVLLFSNDFPLEWISLELLELVGSIPSGLLIKSLSKIIGDPTLNLVLYSSGLRTDRRGGESSSVYIVLLFFSGCFLLCLQSPLDSLFLNTGNARVLLFIDQLVKM